MISAAAFVTFIALVSHASGQFPGFGRRDGNLFGRNFFVRDNSLSGLRFENLFRDRESVGAAADKNNAVKIDHKEFKEDGQRLDFDHKKHNEIQHLDQEHTQLSFADGSREAVDFGAATEERSRAAVQDESEEQSQTRAQLQNGRNFGLGNQIFRSFDDNRFFQDFL